MSVNWDQESVFVCSFSKTHRCALENRGMAPTPKHGTGQETEGSLFIFLMKLDLRREESKVDPSEEWLW
jgi:hypothetical protein